MTIKCPKCHFNHPATMKFCSECGTNLNAVHAETKTFSAPGKGLSIGEVVSQKYKLLEELGRGGMGVVYKAEQIKPVKRSVALKLIKLGMDTRHVIARFETERQALAVMNHPNIAKVFDGGATETGRPYFVMELVRGVPITVYCDKHKLTTRERLELFIQVCQAVQHAHQKGVLHRDLKPSNILVVVQEDKPIPKIIDFGIAKATEHSLTERTLFTEQGQLIGTPEYMSPEQAEMSGLDVDTRTDIYSLGVILYELLVGVLPFDPGILRKAGSGEIQRIIRETDPPKASTRLSGLGDTQMSIAEHRKTDPSSLHRELKGDLDWITVKAMAKDRTERYASTSELAADIERHLKHEPIAAGRPGTLYRIRKYVRRHKVGVAAGAFVIFAIMIGIAGTSIGLLKAVRSEKTAREEAETARQVSDFLERLFKVSDPSEARGNTITAREILDKGAENIEKTLTDQPEVQVRLMATMGRVYTSLGLYSKAESLLEKVVNTQRRLLGEKHPETLIAIHNLANLYWYQNQLNDAESLYHTVVNIRTQVLGEEHPDTLKANYDLASLYLLQRRYGECEKLALKTLESQRRVLDEDHPDTLASKANLVTLYFNQGRYEDAENNAVEILETRQRVLGENHPETLKSMLNLAIIYRWTKDYKKAEELCIKAGDLFRKVLGEDHPDTLSSIELLGSLCLEQELWQQAEEHLLAAFYGFQAALGEEHSSTQRVIKKLCDLYTAWNKPNKAAEYRRLLKDEQKK
ncbi:MAG: tetratricopeptide repeat protein [Candidatus Aminicenantes bacterium]|nr:tetratricopeptide repeat protein [Candidatus Aminicenantes bacterium]